MTWGMHPPAAGTKMSPAHTTTVSGSSGAAWLQCSSDCNWLIEQICMQDCCAMSSSEGLLTLMKLFQDSHASNQIIQPHSPLCLSHSFAPLSVTSSAVLHAQALWIPRSVMSASGAPARGRRRRCPHGRPCGGWTWQGHPHAPPPACGSASQTSPCTQLCMLSDNPKPRNLASLECNRSASPRPASNWAATSMAVSFSLVGNITSHCLPLWA